MKLALISCLFLSSALFAQSKTRVIGSEKKLDYPARNAKEAITIYKKAMRTRSKVQRSKLFGQSLAKFKEALTWLDKFQKDPSLDPNKKYEGEKAKKYKIQFETSAAKAAARSQNYADADKYFANITSTLDPTSYKAWYNYGDYLFGRSKKTVARNAFSNAIKHAEADLSASDKKKVSEAKKYTSRSYYKLGDIASGSKAIENYKKAVSFNTNYWQAFLKMGKAYENAKNYSGMLNAYENVISIMNKKRKGKYIVSTARRIKQLARAIMFKGVAEYNLGKYSSAIKTLKKVDKTKGAKNSDKNSANFHIGMAYLKSGNKNNALKFFKKTKGEFKKAAEYEIDGIKNHS